MKNNELYLQYRQAIQLIRVGRFGDSLHILREIDRERPETKNVLYAMAVCCEMLGRTDEALDLCDGLIARHEHAKARLIKARIEKVASEPDLPKTDPLADLGLRMPPAGNTEAPSLAAPVSGGEPKEQAASQNWLFGFGKKS